MVENQINQLVSEVKETYRKKGFLECLNIVRTHPELLNEVEVNMSLEQAEETLKRYRVHKGNRD